MSAHILIFDSGLGGTTVFDEIHRCLPSCQFSYALDDAAFPYGDKSAAFLQDRIIKLMAKLIQAVQPDLIVIACNTASTLTLDKLREHFSIPFVGVVPAIKPAAANSRAGHIGLLATNATINGDYISALESEFANGCKLHRLSGQGLVTIAEQKMLGFPVDLPALELIITTLTAETDVTEIDTLILGCTHFPALKEEIQMLWPKDIQVLDSGSAIAKRVSYLLSTMEENKQLKVPTVYTTGAYTAASLLKMLQPFGIKQHEKIVINNEI